MNKLAKVLVGLGIAGAAGCAAAQQGEIDSAFLEETAVLQESGDTFYHFAALSAGKDTVLKAMVTDTDDSDLLEWTARGSYRIGGFEGTADIMGMDDSENNSGIGINTRASSGNQTVGFALEKVVDASVPTIMSNVYARHRIPIAEGSFIEVTEGYVDTGGDGRGIIAVTYTAGNTILGAGTIGNDDSRVSTAVAGRFNNESSPGSAVRLWARVDQDGNYFVDLISATKGAFPRKKMAGIVSPDNGQLEPKLMNNRFDARTYLWERGNGLIVHARHAESGSDVTDLLDAVYHFHREGKIFVPRVSAGYMNDAEGKESGSAGIGGGWKSGYFDLGLIFGDGEKPGLTATLGLSAGF